ncbi:uncharacterized protein Triagg1_9116 [Trichoderma aggressivum f. europaeum]|uniref:Uncharacterized protein n=1 Tax=Trichoderma aggressivum f. europaeum TaxID=173218 RepID=A0AAE1I7C5_9HYPO|nr:hypothetical protein Triagg1_9116 [Trichoderma aggressivum f. europaeum]
MKTPTLAVLAALASLQAVAAQAIAGKTIWVDAATCDPWAKSNGFPSAAGPGGLFPAAFDIIDKMVIANSYRIYHPSTQSPTNIPASIAAWERYRLNSTYSALFGNNTATTSIPGGPLGVSDIASHLYGVHFVWGPGIGNPFLIVACDDAPYVSKNSSSGKFVYTDPYHHLPLELPGGSVINDGVTTPCARNGQSGYNNENEKNFNQNIILCTKNMKLPLGFTSNGPTTFASGTTLDVAGKTWLGAFYTQMSWTSGGVGVFGDYSLAYGYAASHAMRNDRHSIFNPDSHKFYNFAQLLDGLFWGSGVGQTSQQEYASLQKTAAGRALIAAFGLTNIAVPARGVNWAAASGWVPPSLENSPGIVGIPRA